MFIKTEYELIDNIYYLKVVINQETGEVLRLDDLFFDTKNYVDDLDKFGLDLVRFLTDKKFKSISDLENLSDKQFFVSYSNGSIGNLVVRIGKKSYKFINFERKFGLPFGELEDNQKLVEFAEKIGADANSLGSSSYNFFLKTILPHNLSSVVRRKIMRKKDFVIFEDRITNKAKDVTSGYQFCLAGKYSNIYEYDQSSAYPSELLGMTPTGAPLRLQSLEAVPKNYWFVVKLFVQNLSLKTGFDWLKLGKNQAPRYLYLTKELFELFKETYTGYFKVREVLAFKTTQRRFNKFVEETIIKNKIKAQEGILSRFCKNLGNSLIGYFGRNTKIVNTIFKKTKEGFKFIHKEAKRDPLYLPLYLFCNGRQKAEFVRTINKFKDKIIYANTDGFFSTEPIDTDLLNYRFTGKIGQFRQKSCYAALKIKAINNYVGVRADGSVENCLAGTTLVNPITLEEYENDNYNAVIQLCNHNLYIEKISVKT